MAQTTHFTSTIAQKRRSEENRDFLNRYPNLGILDDNCVAVDVMGEVSRLDFDEANGMMKCAPLVLLNPEDCLDPSTITCGSKTPKLDQLLKEGLRKKTFIDVARFEGYVAANKDMPQRDKTVPTRRSKLGVTNMFSGFSAKRDSLAQQFVEDYRQAPNEIARHHVLETYYNACVERLSPEMRTKIVKRARDIMKLKRGQVVVGSDLYDPYPRQKEVMIKGISQLPADYLEVLNNHGVYFLCMGPKHQNQHKDAWGLSDCEAGVIQIDVRYIDSENVNLQDILHEEVIHQLDALSGFSYDRKWWDACRKDVDLANQQAERPVARLFLKHANAVKKKKNSFSYESASIPPELLADINYVDTFYNEIIAKLVKKSPKSPKIKAVMDQIEPYISDKETLMNHLFPNTWPLYKEFMQQVHTRAEEIRAEKQSVTPDDWVGHVTSEPSSARTEDKPR